MRGPLVEVKTQTAAIGLDIRRALNMPPGATFHLVRPDSTQPSNWAIVATLSRGWSRVGEAERTRGGAYNVVFRITDLFPEGQLVGWLTGPSKATHVFTDGIYHEITDIPTVAPDKAQVYDITCRTTTLVRASE